MENTNDTENIKTKTKKQRVKRAPWRTTVNEDGTITYSNKPLDPEYNNKYYHEKRIILCSKVSCDLCGSCVSKAHLTRHKQTSKKCGKKQNEIIVSVLQQIIFTNFFK